jgi:FkbM family methyltransferase
MSSPSTPVVSYAQNGEDVVLARVFADANSGFYIDVGASDPVIDSVTKRFYDRGWQGINIEPATTALEKLRDARPRDVNLGVALGQAAGTATFYELPPQMTGCSTLSPEIAEQYRRDGWEPDEHDIEITTLARVCADHVGARDIDFLKVDVEGEELAVLAGADFKRFRPRVLVIEATRPGTPTPAYREWEPLVLSARYEFALFDGLNRFYVRAEDRSLADSLAIPANYFDTYVPYRYAMLQEDAERARLYAQQLTTQAQEANAREQDANAREQEANARERQANTREQEANAREQRALKATAEQEQLAQSIELALEQTRERLRSSQGALRDARTELMASRLALTDALAKRGESTHLPAILPTNPGL